MNEGESNFHMLNYKDACFIHVKLFGSKQSASF
jgi:hypothetical protein